MVNPHSIFRSLVTVRYVRLRAARQIISLIHSVCLGKHYTLNDSVACIAKGNGNCQEGCLQRAAMTFLSLERCGAGDKDRE